ncbi:MAG: ATP-binding cassette subfamily F protein uup [Pseudoalteromonas rhizosphaerae]|jgi:ATP-binding cassette subfamily F protein uup|uniref:ATP-binding protein Uup n=1 Tax=Pseudoalteromonas neustonica TaxID=1840331 RepID=A0ABY3FHZ0_9GAMM|nr:MULTISPECIES: ABC transporter ATP-binding protein [Pseudoalteromonas]MBB1292061.1 ABC transporter ATP-binding protein [Pseudoalteromonas sp. SR41-4]MBB1300373.1 ABC transporter ATP-binding protein [Pseudoalteromonas sp. SR44-8]MBB1308345.1 ABC transporter ATP-binding protein [Pseudoalteromonas sp. SR41-8]MBB1397397.1 ABC transporter ATP-binding protein [Pseudoalteromonas sp. SG44-8]MBB1409002.1 ABC transporter ATP-binding protein [Pseudoalteromonas sp. SG44-17]|tara:strand:+ start:13729 stop:15648 length:1920 start_codon:yes stop_codon:yes gene_type:complete
MDLIRISKAQLAYGTHPLLDNADAVIETGERVCVVGRNGAGKSTLLKVLDGQVILDDGEINQLGSIKISRLEQDPPKGASGSVFDYVAQGMPEIANLLIDFHHVSTELQTDCTDKLLNKLERLSNQLEAADGWRFDSRIQLVLTQLELAPEAKLESLSGGWLRKVALARALVSEPDLLLLDEPTNHLDMESVMWLEQFLKEFKGGIVFISHDRAFIRAVATRILDLDRGKLISYPGDYATYLEQKAHDLKVEETQNALFDKRLAEEETWIRQGVKARRTRNEGRVRELKQLRNERKQRVDQVGKTDFNIETADRSGKLVFEAKHLNHAFNKDKVIANDFSTLVMRGDRIGLVGPNGIGKTTLLKLLFGDIEADAGIVKQGVNLEFAYFDQYRQKLDEEATVQDNVAEGKQEVMMGGRSRHVLGYLQDFLFPPARARTPVKALSGGEKNRLLLAKLFLKPSNILVLDEPTNDLDIETLELLEDIINQYQGTVLIVSHDREFIDNTCTSVWAFEGNGVITDIVGGYSDYEAYANYLSQEQKKQLTTPAKKEAVVAPAPVAKADNKSNKLSYKLKLELEQLPSKLEQLEQALEAQQVVVNDADFFKQDASATTKELNHLAQLESDLEAALERWEELEDLKNQ